MQTIKLYFRTADVKLFAKITKLAENNGISVNQAIMKLLRKEMGK